jgi:hypothetical protein
MLIVNDNICLKPIQDLQKFVDLAYEDNKRDYTKEQLNCLVATYGKGFWDVLVKGEYKGVVGYFVIDGCYILEALRDHSKGIFGISNSIAVGKFMLEHLFNETNEIRTLARVEDKAIQILCNKLGFKEISRENNLIFYKKEK